MSPALRSCIVTAVSAEYDTTVRLKITFPSMYPHGAPPTFEYLHFSSASSNVKRRLLESLTELALVRVRQGRPCLEACLRHLVSTMDKILSEDLGSASDSDDDLPFIRDNNTPVPRTCGAFFFGAGSFLSFLPFFLFSK